MEVINEGELQMKNTVYLYVLDTMADWEIGYLTAELNSGRYYKKGQASSRVVTVGLDKTPVTTMGGLTIMPDITLEECSLSSGDLLIPAGWRDMDRFHPRARSAGCREMSGGQYRGCGDLRSYNGAGPDRPIGYTCSYKQRSGISQNGLPGIHRRTAL